MAIAVKQGRYPGKAVALDGAHLVAEAMRQINPDVVAAYPITPQTPIVEAFSEFVAQGEVTTEFIAVESEHAAMSACIGAAAAGARAQTASSGAGLALMWEVLWVASGTRLPIVMHLVNRSLSAPLNILCDHSDAMGARDAGWLQLFGETGQEAYDNALQAVRIAEHPQVMLPVLHTMDGFIISHGMERAELLPDEAVREFLGEYKPQQSLLDVDHPPTYGPMDYVDYFYEHKRQQQAGMEMALQVIGEVGQEFGRLSGRYYDLLEPYALEDAQAAIVVMGSMAGTVRLAVDQLRRQGLKVGLLKVRSFRPFPSAEVAQALAPAGAVAVLDRALSFGAAANPLFLEVSASLTWRGHHPVLANYVYGLGGRDTLPAQIEGVFRELFQLLKRGDAPSVTRYLGLRE